MDQIAVIESVEERVGKLTDDEAALVRTLSPADLADTDGSEHLKDLVALVATVRHEEAMAEYVYAIAPGWDSTIESLLVAGRVTTAFSRFELESCGAAPASAATRHAAVRGVRLRRVPAPVG
jgi:hypothetical protein